MQRLFNFITKANQILLFFATLAVLGVILFVFYTEFARSGSDKPPEVKIAQTPEEEKSIVIDDVRHIAQAGDLHIFGIIKRIIGKPPGFAGKTLRMQSAEDDNSYGQTVNVVFTRNGQKIKTLLPSDGMIMGHQFNELYGKFSLKALLFQCIAEDTDNNHVLNDKDRTDLYIVSRDLSKPDLVIKGISNYDVISDNIVLVKTRSGDTPIFTEINVETLEKKEIHWK